MARNLSGSVASTIALILFAQAAAWSVPAHADDELKPIPAARNFFLVPFNTDLTKWQVESSRVEVDAYAVDGVQTTVTGEDDDVVFRSPGLADNGLQMGVGLIFQGKDGDTGQTTVRQFPTHDGGAVVRVETDRAGQTLYFKPRFAGFRAGASYTPPCEDERSATVENIDLSQFDTPGVGQFFSIQDPETGCWRHYTMTEAAEAGLLEPVGPDDPNQPPLQSFDTWQEDDNRFGSAFYLPDDFDERFDPADAYVEDEIWFVGQTTLDNGITFGATVEFESHRPGQGQPSGQEPTFRLGEVRFTPPPVVQTDDGLPMFGIPGIKSVFFQATGNLDLPLNGHKFGATQEVELGFGGGFEASVGGIIDLTPKVDLVLAATGGYSQQEEKRLTNIGLGGTTRLNGDVKQIYGRVDVEVDVHLDRYWSIFAGAGIGGGEVSMEFPGFQGSDTALFWSGRVGVIRRLLKHLDLIAGAQLRGISEFDIKPPGGGPAIPVEFDPIPGLFVGGRIRY